MRTRRQTQNKTNEQPQQQQTKHRNNNKHNNNRNKLQLKSHVLECQWASGIKANIYTCVLWLHEIGTFCGFIKHATFLQSQHLFVDDVHNIRLPPAFQEPCSGGCWGPARKLQRAPRQPFFKFPGNQTFSQHRNLRGGDLPKHIFTKNGASEGGERGGGEGREGRCFASFWDLHAFRPRASERAREGREEDDKKQQFTCSRIAVCRVFQKAGP